MDDYISLIPNSKTYEINEHTVAEIFTRLFDIQEDVSQINTTDDKVKELLEHISLTTVIIMNIINMHISQD